MAVTSPRPSLSAFSRRTNNPWFATQRGEFLLTGILVFTSLITIWLSWRWPLVLDGPLLQYCAFLMDHGKVPYKDILDVNGLGAFFSSWLEIHLFGYSDLAWRIYDLLFLLLGSVGIAYICKPFGLPATVFGSCMLILTHIRRGPNEIGERDFQMTVLVLLGVGFMLQGFRDGKRGWFLASGALIFLGGTIKPAGLLFLGIFLTQAIVITFRRKQRLTRPLLMVLGAAIPCFLAGVYLWSTGAWWSFVELCRKVIPIYASFSRPWSLLTFIMESNTEILRLLILPSGLLLVCKLENWLTTESATVFLGVCGGFVSYWIQRKGWPYHLDPLIAFLGIWCGIVIVVLLRDSRVLVRLPTMIAVAFWVFMWIPRLIYVSAAHSTSYANSSELASTHRLEAEISKFRSAGKNKGIQIMNGKDTVHALYDLKLVQSSGFLYDLYFFAKPDDPFSHELRVRFLRSMNVAQPDLLVVSQDSYPDPDTGYKRIDRWPELKSYLQTNYDLRIEHAEYRIYVRR